MRHTPLVLAIVLAAVLPAVGARGERSLPPSGADELAASDEQILAAAGIGTNGPALLDFFRQRTLTDADRARLEEWVRRLGSDRFRARETASAELVRRGRAALPFLKRALASADAEVARRARACLTELEDGRDGALALAAARRLARRPPPDTVPTLLRFLPFAADDALAEEIRGVLLTASPEGKPLAPALLAALADPLPLLRATAAHVVSRRGDRDQRQAVRGLLRDPEPRVRFRAALGLLAVRDRQAVPALVALLEDGPMELAWQAEDVLFRLAGEKGPSTALGTGADERRRSRSAWAAWWARNGPQADLARLDETDRLLGFTLGIEYNTGRVWECGMDGRLRWELKSLRGPMEAQVLPGGRVLVAESTGRTVSERDFQGNVLWERRLDFEATGCQRLPNGNTFVSGFSTVAEYTRDGKTVYAFALPHGSNAIRKHRNGHIVLATDRAILEVDTTGRKVRSVPIPHHSMYIGIRDLSGGRFLVANNSSGRVLEVDGGGKVLWEARFPGACGIARLPNGHTLVSTANVVAELDRSGKRVWEVRSPGYVRRVHRR